MEAKKWSYFQYFKQLDIPIYLQLDLSSFHLELVTLLAKMNFFLLTAKEWDAAQVALGTNKKSRLLKLEMAEGHTLEMIHGSLGGSTLTEAVMHRLDYKIYRYKAQAAMIYSSLAREWEMGVVKDFGSEANCSSAKMALGRFLSLALAPLGYVGFFGNAVDEGMVVLRPSEVMSEIIFINPIEGRVLANNGDTKLLPSFQFIKLDPALKSKKLELDKSSLLSFLSMNCSFMDTEGATTPIRQMIFRLGCYYRGMSYPKEMFRPRLDLSL